MKYLKAIISWIGMVIAGMWGGQRDKAVRRQGVPSIAIATGWSFGWRWQYLGFIWLAIILTMGYGVDSKLGELLGHTEWLIRLVYGLLLSLPFYLFGLWRGLIASCALILAYSIHAGRLCGFMGYDILIEDLVRFGVLGALVIINIIKRRKS
jgi:hypothetical protein